MRRTDKLLKACLEILAEDMLELCESFDGCRHISIFVDTKNGRPYWNASASFDDREPLALHDFPNGVGDAE